MNVIELGPLAVDTARAAVAGFPGEALQEAIDRLAAADAIIVATPIYKAGISGLLKTFVDILDNDLIVAKPVLLAATGGTPRHALVIDDQLRPLFAYMRALTLPTSVYAAPEDWGTSELGTRIERAASELAVMVQAGVEQQIADRAWTGYQHQFAGNARRAERSANDVDFDSPLMRLAAGGGGAAEVDHERRVVAQARSAPLVRVRRGEDLEAVDEHVIQAPAAPVVLEGPGGVAVP